MSNWIGNVISALALGASGYSLFIAKRTAQRAIDAEKITAWIELNATGDPRWFCATVTVKNPSPVGIKVQKISIDPPDFRLGDIDAASVDDGMGNRILPKDFTVKEHCLAMPLRMSIGASETDNATFLIYQPAHSQRRSTKLKLMYWTMEPEQKWRILPVTVNRRSNLTPHRRPILTPLRGGVWR
jgi:hypothetical protein